jgi:hypothetical protein
MKIAVIEYIDSNMTHEQTSEIVKPEPITTVGFVIDEKDEYITLAAELIGGEYRRQVSIPKVAVLKTKSKGEYLVHRP